MTEYHIAKTGKQAGQLVRCYAKNCRNNVPAYVVDDLFPQDDPNFIASIPEFGVIARMNLAKQPASPAVLEVLAKDPDEEVCYLVVFNDNLTQEAENILAEDKELDILRALAQHTQSSETLEKLSKYEGDLKDVVYTVAISNKNCPADAIARVWRDVDYKIHHKVARHPNITPETINDMVVFEIESEGWSDIRTGAARNPKTSTATLNLIAEEKSTNSEALGFVAKHKNVSVETLTALANNEDGFVRMMVAENPNTPERVLLGLALDASVAVRSAASKNITADDNVKAAAALAGGVFND